MQPEGGEVDVVRVQASGAVKPVAEGVADVRRVRWDSLRCLSWVFFCFVELVQFFVCANIFSIVVVFLTYPKCNDSDVKPQKHRFAGRELANDTCTYLHDEDLVGTTHELAQHVALPRRHVVALQVIPPGVSAIFVPSTNKAGCGKTSGITLSYKYKQVGCGVSILAGRVI